MYDLIRGDSKSLERPPHLAVGWSTAAPSRRRSPLSHLLERDSVAPCHLEPDSARRKRFDTPTPSELPDEEKAPTRRPRLARRSRSRRIETRASVSDLDPDHVIEHQRLDGDAVLGGNWSVFDGVGDDLARQQGEVLATGPVAQSRQRSDRLPSYGRRLGRSRKRQTEFGVKLHVVPLRAEITRGRGNDSEKSLLPQPLFEAGPVVNQLVALTILSARPLVE